MVFAVSFSVPCLPFHFLTRNPKGVEPEASPTGSVFADSDMGNETSSHSLSPPEIDDIGVVCAYKRVWF